jgi:negative regulator of flagellin synthesis FlgM
MQIDNRVQAIGSVYAKASLTNQNSVKKSINVDQKDEMVLSTEAQSFSQMLQRARSMSDVRADKVEDYSAQVNAGKYQVDSQAVAGKILNIRF